MMCLAALMCPGVALEQYCAIMFVIVAISGRVCVDSQLREPTCLGRVAECFSVSVWFELSSGMESTGWPERYGVRGGLVAASWRPASSIIS